MKNTCRLKTQKLYIRPLVSVMAVIFAISGVSCDSIRKSGDDVPTNTVDLFAMDTYMRLTAYGEECNEAIDEAIDEINRLDDMFSIGNTESEVAILNEKGNAIFSRETEELLEKSLQVYEDSNGAFDITIYPLMFEWGFVNKDYHVPTDDTIKKLLANVGSDKIKYERDSGYIELPDGVEIDFGGIAKGYTSQRVMEIFKNHNITGGIVSLGGNVQSFGTKPDGSLFNVGVKDPYGEDEYVGTLLIDNKTVITSGGYERFFEENGVIYQHIIDPATGKPADSGLKSVTIINEDGTYADALSTAIYVMGKEKAIKLWKEKANFDMILVEEDGKVVITEGIEKVFDTDKDCEVIKKK